MVADLDLDVAAAGGHDARRHEIHASDEARDEFRGGPAIERLRGPLLHDRAAAHDGDAVGDRHRLFLVVRDVDGGDRQRLLQRTDLRAHADPELRVEVRQRLVEEQHAWAGDDRPRQGDALLLAARELLRELALVAGEPDQRQHLADGGGDPTVRCGKSAWFWKTKPMLRRLASRPVTSSSPMRTRPASGRSKPAIIRSVVVLPQPDGPSSVTSSPGATVRLTSRAA